MIVPELISVLMYVLSYYVGGFVAGMAKEEHEEAKKYLSWTGKLHYFLPLTAAIAIYTKNLNVALVPIILFLLTGAYDYSNTKTMKRVVNLKIGFYTWNAAFYFMFTFILLIIMQVLF